MRTFNLEQTINNIKNIKAPSKFKKIGFESKMIIGCIPVKATPVQPEDQSPCIIEKCNSCNQEMWVSEKKRKHREEKPNVEIYCFFCIILSSKAQGYDLPMQTLDIESLV